MISNLVRIAIMLLMGVFFVGSVEPVLAMPCGKALSQKERLFPQFSVEPGTQEFLVYWALRNKWIERRIMDGGPFAQPEYFYLIKYPDPKKFPTELNEGFIAANVGVGREFLVKSNTMTPENVVDSIMSGSLAGPWVLKPTFGALGQKVIILRRKGDVFVATLVREKRQFIQIQLDQRGYRKEVADSGNVVHYHIPAEKSRLQDLIDLSYSPSSNGLSAAMIEAFVPGIKINGQAFETRHNVLGNLAEMRVDEVEDIVGKAGESGWFSNQWSLDKPVKAYTKRGRATFDPLIQAGFVRPEKKGEFIRHVHKQLSDAYLHFAQRLADEGFSFGGGLSGLQFDLMWLPPKKGEEFPTPVLVEQEWHYRNVKMYEVPPSMVKWSDPSK